MVVGDELDAGINLRISNENVARKNLFFFVLVEELLELLRFFWLTYKIGGIARIVWNSFVAFLAIEPIPVSLEPAKSLILDEMVAQETKKERKTVLRTHSTIFEVFK